MTTPLSRTTRNAIVIALSTFITRAVQFGWIILLGQLLGASDFGLYGTIGGIVTIAASIAEFGIGLIVLRDVAHSPSKAGAYLSAATLTQIVLSLLAYSGLIVFTLFTPDEPVLRFLLLIAGINLFIDTLGNICHNQLLAVEKMIATSVITVVHMFFLIAFTFAVLFSGGSLLGLYCAAIVAGACRVLMYWTVVLRSGIKPEFPVQIRIIRKLLQDGLPLALGSIFYLIYQHIDKIIVLMILTPADAGYLTAAFTIVFGVVELTNTTVLVAVFPMMSRLKDNIEALQGLVNRLAGLMFFITLPIGITISLLSTPLSAILFPRFSGTAAVLEILIWSTIVTMIGTAYAQYFIIQNQQRRTVLVRAVGLSINIVLNLLLLPRIGLRGAGIAAIATEIFILSVYIIMCQLNGFNLRSVAVTIGRLLFAGIVMAITVLVLRSYFMLAGITGMLVYLAVVMRLRILPAEDWNLLTNFVRKLPVVGTAIGQRLAFLTRP